MPTSDIGIDLGTRNSLAYSTGKGLVLNEPSIVVYDKNTEKIKAIGEEARQMTGHVTSDMEIIRPIRQGVIVDYTVTEKMLKYFISRAIGRRAFRKPRISICVPSGITEIEKKAVEEATYQAGAREVFLVEEPIAAAIVAGVDISKPFGNLIDAVAADAIGIEDQQVKVVRRSRRIGGCQAHLDTQGGRQAAGKLVEARRARHEQGTLFGHIGLQGNELNRTGTSQRD